MTQKSKQTETLHIYTGYIRARQAPPHRPNYKRIIERFFGSRNLSTKTTEKSSVPVLKLSVLMALVEDARRQVELQTIEHKRTLRGRNSRSRK